MGVQQIPISILLAAFLLSLLLTPISRWLSIKTQRVSYPRQDRWSKKPTAILGGVAIYGAFLVSVIWLIPEFQFAWPLLISSTAMFLLGLFDDFREISPPTKIIGQILASGFLIYSGYRIEFFSAELLNILLTFAWIIVITNAVNLIDNMDGLAGGIALIVSGFLAYFFFQIPDQSIYFAYTLALCGAIAGFLVYNFPPAKIFMGDSGSMFIGFTLASLAVIKKTSASNVLAVLGIPMLLFLLPILDTSLVTITRILRGQSPVQGGKDHTSHRLVAFGLDERQTLLVLYGVAIISGVASTIIERAAYDFSLVFVPVLVVGLSIFAAYLGRLHIGAGIANPSEPSAISKVFARLTYRQRIFEVFLDFFIISIAYYLALWTQYDLRFSSSGLDLFAATLPIALAGTYFSFFIFGIYRGVWEYFGVSDLVVFLKSVIGATLLVSTIIWMLGIMPDFRLLTFILFGMFLLIAVVGTRSSFRILDQVFSTRSSPGKSNFNVLLFGAEEYGEFIARWLIMHPESGYKPVGFIDADQRKWGREIHGIKVLGGVDRIGNFIENYQPTGIIITSPGAWDNQTHESLLQICKERGIWLKIIRFDFESIDL